MNIWYNEYITKTRRIMNKEDITVYATHTCGFCHALTDWLNDNKIDHEVKMVDSDMEAQKEFLERINGNFQGVPVTFIKDKMILGFDRNAIKMILEENGVELKEDEF